MITTDVVTNKRLVHSDKGKFEYDGGVDEHQRACGKGRANFDNGTVYEGQWLFGL